MIAKLIHDQAMPPFDRLRNSGQFPPTQEAQLRALRAATNPIKLRQEIEQLLRQLFDLPLAQDGCPEDVHKTLELWKNVPLTIKYISIVSSLFLPEESRFQKMLTNQFLL